MAVFSELGVILISIDVIKLSVGFWNHLVNSDEVSLIEQAYKFNFKHFQDKTVIKKVGILSCLGESKHIFQK